MAVIHETTSFDFFSFLDFGVWPPLASSRIHYLTVTDSLDINYNIELHSFPAQKTSMLKHGFARAKYYNAKYHIIDLMPSPIIVICEPCMDHSIIN